VFRHAAVHVFTAVAILLHLSPAATMPAGHETTTKAVMWAMFLLAKHPEWQVRLRDEVRAVCGSPGPGAAPPTFEQLSDLPLLVCVIHETLRLYPPAIYFDRYATQDVTVQATVSERGPGVGVRLPLRRPTFLYLCLCCRLRSGLRASTTSATRSDRCSFPKAAS
jgi:hypothetical protein